jgi:hypothetical protein
MNSDNILILKEGQAVGRKTILMLAVGAFVGALAGGAMADILGDSQQSEQVRLTSVTQEFVPEGNWGGTDWQVSHLVETVAMPVMVAEESWMKDYGND